MEDAVPSMWRTLGRLVMLALGLIAVEWVIYRMMPVPDRGAPAGSELLAWTTMILALILGAALAYRSTPTARTSVRVLASIMAGVSTWALVLVPTLMMLLFRGA